MGFRDFGDAACWEVKDLRASGWVGRGASITLNLNPKRKTQNLMRPKTVSLKPMCPILVPWTSRV